MLEKLELALGEGDWAEPPVGPARVSVEDDAARSGDGVFIPMRPVGRSSRVAKPDPDPGHELGESEGPDFTFNEAISFQVSCETQEEVGAFWSTLSEGGEEGPCGWLKDKFGVSWQIIPTALPELLGDPDPEKSQRVMQAMLSMKKIEIGALERAAAQT